MKYKYYQVYEYFPIHDGDGKRLIYTFDERASALDLIQFILKRDLNFPVLGVEEHETTA